MQALASLLDALVCVFRRARGAEVKLLRRRERDRERGEFSTMSVMAPLGLLLLSVIWLLPSVSAFYLPGVAPRDFKKVRGSIPCVLLFTSAHPITTSLFFLFLFPFLLASIYFSWIDAALSFLRFLPGREPKHGRSGLWCEGLMRTY